MYFGWLHKKTPENFSINDLKEISLDMFRVVGFFSSTWNDRMFHFPRALEETFSH